jgi:hypothetical protein
MIKELKDELNVIKSRKLNDSKIENNNNIKDIIDKITKDKDLEL